MIVGKRDIKQVMFGMLIGFVAGAIITYALVYKKQKQDGVISGKVCMQALVRTANMRCHGQD